MKRVKYARQGGELGCRYENPYFRAGEDPAVFASRRVERVEQPNLTQYRNHSMFRGQFVTELVPSLVQRRGAQT